MYIDTSECFESFDFYKQLEYIQLHINASFPLRVDSVYNIFKTSEFDNQPLLYVVEYLKLKCQRNNLPIHQSWINGSYRDYVTFELKLVGIDELIKAHFYLDNLILQDVNNNIYSS